MKTNRDELEDAFLADNLALKRVGTATPGVTSTPTPSGEWYENVKPAKWSLQNDIKTETETPIDKEADDARH